MRNPLSAFADPHRRPKAIMWTAVVLIAAFTLYGASMTVTSTTWFCNDVCHNVHFDNQRQYHASSHSEISCIACHYPPDLDPARFALDRVDKLLDVYPTIAGTFEMPLNAYSRLALKTSSAQCTQCHGTHRRVTPVDGLRIDHETHAQRGISCTVCHNRVAHPEKFALTLPGNRKHEDFMTMRACFRCHTLTATSPSTFTAPGTCRTCHTPDFKLVPASHEASGGAWVTPVAGGMSLHAQAARADSASVSAARRTWAADRQAFLDKQPRIIMRLIGVDTERPLDLPPAATVSQCDTCHVRATFCDPCHARKGVRTAP